MKEFALYGKDLFGEVVKPKPRGKVAEAFTVPPFSVLNAREGFWQERKRMWLNMGIQSEVGRNAACNVGAKNGTLLVDIYRGKEDCGHNISEDGTSIFDPVLSELFFKWFCPPSGQIIDPFAGGSVRGVVASLLGFQYWGCELREEQVDANRKQGQEICEQQPTWICGDSLVKLYESPDADFLFSCPPYGDLEKYSDLPQDLSNMDWHAFLPVYKNIVRKACSRLKNDRFAAFVVGDFRSKKGFYRNFVSETIAAFQNAGLNLYNECIYITPIGSLPVRITRQFNAARKIGKTHQNVLVFVKGDPKVATNLIQGAV
jgi:DNA modification methylase